MGLFIPVQQGCPPLSGRATPAVCGFGVSRAQLRGQRGDERVQNTLLEQVHDARYCSSKCPPPHPYCRQICFGNMSHLQGKRATGWPPPARTVHHRPA